MANNKHTYEYIKNFIEIESNSGCKLISEEYINVDRNLKLQCACGEYFNVSFSNFKRRGQRKCKICNNFTDWDINKAKDFCSGLGYKLIDDVYKNIITDMTMQDDYGYFYYTNINNLKSKSTPTKFHISNSYTIQNIKLWCSLNNTLYELLDDQEYISNRIKLKWKCLKDNCGEIFESNWSDIFQGRGCPFCRGLKIGLSNCLATKNSELAKQWHPTLNGDLTPYDVSANSGKHVWWICDKGHEWEAQINSRSRGNGCPYCSGLYPTNENNLLVVHPELCKEWNYNRNSKKPEEYTPCSGLYVWWLCPKCGHEWEIDISNRVCGNGCPQCSESKGEKRIKNYFNGLVISFIWQKEFDGLLGLGGGLLSYDFYLPQYNLLIEYQGEQHERYIPGFHKSKKDFEKQQEHDRRKREYAHINNINLLQIWYYDFDNIEEILKRELMINV